MGIYVSIIPDKDAEFNLRIHRDEMTGRLVGVIEMHPNGWYGANYDFHIPGKTLKDKIDWWDNFTDGVKDSLVNVRIEEDTVDSD